MARPAFRPAVRREVGALLDNPRFEIVPLHGALELTRALPDGATVTVTSSPTRGLEATISLAAALAERGFDAVPHLAARQVRDESELCTAVKQLDESGVRDVFVIGGDTTEPAGEFPDGLALLVALDRLGHPFDRIGVPSYPEGHHAIDTDVLWADLEAKQRYSTYTVTQLCFDADVICRFATAAKLRGIKLPIHVGVPGAVDMSKLLRISLKVGVGESLRFVRGNRRTTTRLFRPRGYRPDALVRKLAARARDRRCEFAGVHIYTFNQVGATVGWLNHGGVS